MRSQAKAAGGRWDPWKRLWFVKYSKIAGTQLEKHIYVDRNLIQVYGTIYLYITVTG
jgi:hypothetical protein